MFVLKLGLGIAFIVLGVKIGVNRANKYKEEYLFWKSMLYISNKTYSELEFQKNKIEKILSVEFQSTDFQKMINTFLKSSEIVYPNYLLNEEKIYVNEFFISIVKSDTTSLKSTLKSLNVEFSKILNIKELIYRKYFNLSIKLGFFAGFSLLIMVI